jgi:sugar phosphate isomerase/epimerase
MTDWPVGLSTGCFYQRPISEVLETIRNGGFSTIEICSFPAHLDYHDHRKVDETAQLIRDLGMDAFSFHAPFRDAIDITALDVGQREAALAELLAAADSAAAMGVRHFVIHPGPDRTGKPPEAEYIARMENAAGMLSRVADHCLQRGMRLVLENMLPHLLFGRSSDVLWIMGAIKNLNVGICLDTGHAHIAGDLYAAVHKLSGHLQMVHANDNHAQWDQHLPPGKGGIDWKRLVSRLAEMGFRGGMILELSSETGPNPEELLREAQRSRAFLQEIFRDVELHGKTDDFDATMK